MQLALMDSAVLVPVQELDGIFNSNYVVVLCFVDQVDDCSKRRGFARAGRASQEHDTVLHVRDFFQNRWYPKLFERRDIVGYNAHDDGVSTALFEDVDSESRQTSQAER